MIWRKVTDSSPAIFTSKKGVYNEIFIDTNKIATVFGRDELNAYIKKQIADGNLVRIKNRSAQASESQSPINSDYSKNASTNINISQNTPVVNANSMQNDGNLENMHVQLNYAEGKEASLYYEHLGTNCPTIRFKMASYIVYAKKVQISIPDLKM